MFSYEVRLSVVSSTPNNMTMIVQRCPWVREISKVPLPLATQSFAEVEFLRFTHSTNSFISFVRLCFKTPVAGKQI